MEVPKLFVIKMRAKQLSRETGEKLSRCYEELAKLYGFPSWNHMAAFYKKNLPASPDEEK